ncbi:MAG: acylneuraminate cytidylyltransferase family protein [Anaerolineales bacterium]
MADDVSGESIQPGVVALVPMRHESERVPQKNFRPLAGKPLYAHILETLQACAQVAQIVVDTDSPTIWEGIEAAFPEIVLLERPERLRGGHVPMNEVLLHDVSQVPAQFYLQTHSTNPLLKAATIKRGLDEFLAAYPENDSLFSVTRLQARLWSAETKPLNHDPAELIRTQDLAPVFLENSCLYIFERESFLQRENRIGNSPIRFEIDADEAIDIDRESDFAVVECLAGTRGN